MDLSEYLQRLQELLDMSDRQFKCLDEERLDEAVDILKQRQTILESFTTKDLSGVDKNDARVVRLLKDLRDSESRLIFKVAERSCDTVMKLSRHSEAKKVISAYNESIRH